MSRHDEREITRRLADTPAGEPPPELLDRLRADIPEDLTAGLEARGEGIEDVEDMEAAKTPGPAMSPTPFSRRWLAAAATLVMLVAGGFLAWKLTQEVGPLGRSHVDGPPATESTADTAGSAERTGTAETVEPTESAKVTGAPAVDPAGEVPAEEPTRDESRDRAALAGDAAPVEQAFEDISIHAELPMAEEAAPAPPTGDLATSAPGTAAAPPPATPSSTSSARSGPSKRSLEIQVVDSADGGLPGATVRVEGEGQARVKFSDAEGKVEFEDLSPGEYEVTSLLDGFGTVVDPAVEMPSGKEPVKREVVLPVAIAEEVTVMAKAPRIDKSSTAASATYRESSPPEVPPHRLGRPSVPPPPRAETERRRRSAAPEAALQAVELEVVAEPVEGSADDQAPEVTEIEAKPELASKAPPEPPAPTNPVVETAQDRLSTFGLDVDTGSFTLLRAHLEAGRMPPAPAVRVEEVVNAQPFSDPFAEAPVRLGETFRVTADGAPSPFTPDRSHRLLRFRVSARELPPAERKPAVLTLVVDVSGSMEGEGLELVRAGVGWLLESLRPGDRVALVVFSDDARLVVPHGEPAALAREADALATEGGTNAEAGLVLGYDTARQVFDPAAVNRVVLLSDGVANVGATGPEAILERVAAAAADGIELTTVGVGMGDFNDRMMETLADRGDGRYAYADDRREMERLFAEELDGTLQTVAEEARAQVEFDPRVVESWRQVGYEDRAIADHEFRYDAVDAGEIGPGHSVTALYEVKLHAEPAPGRPLALLKLRWREPAGAEGKQGRFREIEERLTAEDLAASWSAADPDLRLAAVAAELAEHLRGSPHATSAPSTLLTEARRLTAAGVSGAAELVELAEAWRRLGVPAADAEEPGDD